MLCQAVWPSPWATAPYRLLPFCKFANFSAISTVAQASADYCLGPTSTHVGTILSFSKVTSYIHVRPETVSTLTSVLYSPDGPMPFYHAGDSPAMHALIAEMSG
jgi:hypothetical protein